jgi:hypothetical protein
VQVGAVGVEEEVAGVDLVDARPGGGAIAPRVDDGVRGGDAVVVNTVIGDEMRSAGSTR